MSLNDQRQRLFTFITENYRGRCWLDIKSGALQGTFLITYDPLRREKVIQVCPGPPKEIGDLLRLHKKWLIAKLKVWLNRDPLYTVPYQIEWGMANYSPRPPKNFQLGKRKP